MTTIVARHSDTLTVAIAFGSFVVLGMGMALLGLAWPGIREQFGLPLDGIWPLLLSQTAGYNVSSFFSGRVMGRLGTSRTLVISACLFIGGALSFVFSPVWALIVIGGFVNGLGTGTIDAGLNNYIAANFGSRHMNWLHASFGIGTTIMPLVMTQAFRMGFSWRYGYGFVGIVMIVVVVAFAVTRSRWRISAAHDVGEPGARNIGITETLRLPLLWLSVALFIFYAGVEIGVGNWAFTLFTEGRGINELAASQWVTVYWGSFTVSRILFGFVGSRWKLTSMLRGCMLLAVFGATLFWLNFTEAVGFFGLAVLGFALAPIFPMLILETSDRLGRKHAANAIGIQVAAAGVGVAVLPGLQGTVANNFGLETLGPFFLGSAICVFVLYELTLLLRSRLRAATSASGLR